jgi:hypothetical protein
MSAAGHGHEKGLARAVYFFIFDVVCFCAYDAASSAQHGLQVTPRARPQIRRVVYARRVPSLASVYRICQRRT